MYVNMDKFATVKVELLDGEERTYHGVVSCKFKTEHPEITRVTLEFYDGVALHIMIGQVKTMQHIPPKEITTEE